VHFYLNNQNFIGDDGTFASRLNNYEKMTTNYKCRYVRKIKARFASLLPISNRQFPGFTTTSMSVLLLVDFPKPMRSRTSYTVQKPTSLAKEVLSNMDNGRFEVEMDVNPRNRDGRDRMSDGPPKLPSRSQSICKAEDDDDGVFMETCPPPEKTGSVATEESSYTTPTTDVSSGNAGFASEVEIEAAIMARIPAHIRNQLSQEEWREIIEPDSMSFEDGAEGFSSSFCSDITDDISSYLPKLKPNAISDALYCKEEEIKSPVRGESIVATEAEQADHDGRRRISFGKVQVRRFERILEVHPCTSSGPSLGLGWMYEDEESPQTIDWLKANRRANQLLMSRDKRERLVREELGYSSREVALAIRACIKIKNQRCRTINNLKECNSIVPVEKVEYLVEKCHRKLRNIQKRFTIPSAA
jgi:hypothetical protein